MAKTIQSEFRPDYVSHPGETLEDVLEAQGMSQAELAQQTGRSPQLISDIIEGKAPITPDMALQLEHTLGGLSAHFWNKREQGYREALERLKDKEPLEVQIKWLNNFPVKELIKQDWIEDWQAEPDEQLWELLYFFDVTFPKEWEREWNGAPVAMFLKSSEVKSNPYALSAWLRKGELEAEEIECAPYDKERFQAALQEIRALTIQPPEQFLEPLVQHCAEAGVAVVFVPALSQISVSGATRWLAPDLALIQLTLEYKSDDHFWFSFYHEAGHIMSPSPDKQVILLESEIPNARSERELQANQFAAEMLIPKAAYQEFVKNLENKEEPTSDSICRFAQEIGIAPGIVVGQLQRDGHLPAGECNDLKQKIELEQRK